MLIRSIDFETSGIPGSDEQHAVCEVGFTDIDISTDGVHICEPDAILCNPGRPISIDSRAVHHIGDVDVADAMPADKALGMLVACRPDYFCAHNADFERAFFDGDGVPFICTYKVALRLWPDAPGHSLQVLRYWLDLDIDPDDGLPAHRAGPDAYVGAELMARILADENAPDLDTMVRWSSGPPLLTRVAFGKHKGSKWDDLPSDYLIWIADKSDLDPGTKANALYRLKQRGQR